MNLRELANRLLAAGVLPGDLRIAIVAWFVRKEIKDHENDMEAIKIDIRLLRDFADCYHGSPQEREVKEIIEGAREFLFIELARHERDAAEYRSRLGQFSAPLREKIEKVPLKYVSMEV